MKKGNNYLRDAFSITELYDNMELISADDNKKMKDYTVDDYVSEATWILSCIEEGGHILNEYLKGEYGKQEQLYVRKQRAQLKRFVEKYSPQCKKINSLGCV